MCQNEYEMNQADLEMNEQFSTNKMLYVIFAISPKNIRLIIINCKKADDSPISLTLCKEFIGCL